MAFVEFDVTTMTTANTTMPTDDGGLHYYGAMFGGIQKGDTSSTSHHWIRLPNSAPPIGEMPTTTAPGLNEDWGAFLCVPTTVAAGVAPKTAIGVYGFARGSRWFCIDPGVPALCLSKSNKFKVWYRSVNEGINIDI